MAINLNHLRVFEAVGRTGRFSKAAQALSVTQPAITVQMRQLEQHCGVSLVDRLGRRGVRLTDAGHSLYPYAQRIIALAREAEDVLSLARGFKTGRLRLVSSLTAAAYYLPPLVAAFKQRYPDVQVQLLADNSRGVAERILALDDDLGVLGGELRNPDLVFEPFCEDPLILIVSTQHPWARRRTVSIRELADQPFIMREAGSATRDVIESRLAAEGLTLQTTMELGSNEAIKRTVEMGHGVALISAAIAQREIKAGELKALRVREPGLLRRYYFVYHREKRESPLVRAMLDVSRQSLARPSP